MRFRTFDAVTSAFNNGEDKTRRPGLKF